MLTGRTARTSGPDTTAVTTITPKDEVRAAVDRLRTNQSEWEMLGVAGRVHWLNRHRDWLRGNEDRIVRLLQQETGKAESEAALEFRRAVDTVGFYLSHAAEFLGGGHPHAHHRLTATTRVEIDTRHAKVVGVLGPWNYPLALSMVDAIPALIAGTAVLIAPPPETSVAVATAVAGWAEIGAPTVLESVVGDDIEPIVADSVDYLRFTGSAETGRMLAQRAAGRLISCGLRLRGKDPAIVLADAELDLAAAGIAFGGLSYSGQMDTSVERIYVQEAVYDAFVDKLVGEVQRLQRVLSHESELGAMVTHRQVRVVHDQAADAIAKGATVRIGGSGSGLFFEPTVLGEVDHEMAVMTAATSGPILPVMRVRDADEAVHLANAVGCGLSASVWTRDLKLGTQIGRRLDAVTVDIDNASVHVAGFHVPN